MLLGNKFCQLLHQQPSACAQILGSQDFPVISGWAYFYQINDGVLLLTEVNGLPSKTEVCGPSIFGFHIHEGSSCTGTAETPFANAGKHYNPQNCEHPEHAGDLPPLFGNQGYAFSAVYTSRFTIQEVIGRTMVIHASRDDFTTQPSGASGEMIACGQITRTGCIWQ